MIASFIEFLHSKREEIVTKRDFVIEGYDPTYGPNNSVEEIEFIDFDALLAAMDEFSETFKETQT